MSEREHNPDKCEDGDDCVPCLKAALRARAATIRVDDGTRKRVAERVMERLKSAVMGDGGKPGPALAALLVALALVLPGCVAPEAIEQARTEAAINHGHATDSTLPLEARQIAADGERAWLAQHVALVGDPVPGSEAWGPLPPELAPVVAPGGGR